MLSTTHPVNDRRGRGGTDMKALNNRKRDLRGIVTVHCEQKLDEWRTCPEKMPLPTARDRTAARTLAAAAGWSTRGEGRAVRDYCPQHPQEAS